MGKYVREIQLDQPIDVVSMVMDDYMYHNGYTRGDWNGEMVYVSTKYSNRYMMWYYAAGLFHVEVWTKGMFGGAGAPGATYTAEVTNLISRLQRQSAAGMAGGHIGSDPLHHDSNHGSNHDNLRRDTNWQKTTAPAPSKPVYTTTNTRPTTAQSGQSSAEASQYLGLAAISVIFAFVFPIVGLILALVVKNKLKFASSAVELRAQKMATTALTLAIITLMFHIISAFASGSFVLMNLL